MIQTKQLGISDDCDSTGQPISSLFEHVHEVLVRCLKERRNKNLAEKARHVLGI